ncbi:hypothetical protein FKP32DRAFT_1549919, partial [Trametes sanguinea]
SDTSDTLARDAIVLPWWIPSSNADRLRTFLEYKGPDTRVALSKIPASATWGTSNNMRYLSLQGHPIQVWVVGVLDSMSFFASTADNNPGTAIAISLLRDTDRDALTALKKKSKPPPPITRYLTCLQLFPHVYDATVAYTDKLYMKRLPTSALVAGDVVLVELAVVRCDVGPKKPRSVRADWKVDFELQSIARLVARPVVKEERVSSNF